MTFYNLFLPSKTAERCVLLLDEVLPRARQEGLDCSFLLAVGSLLLGQTNDKVQKPDFADTQLNVALNAFRRQIDITLRQACSVPKSEDARLPFLEPASYWRALRGLRLSADEFRIGPESLLSGPKVDPGGLDWQCGTFFKHLRNALAHGNVWWGMETSRSPRSRFLQRPTGDQIGLVFMMSRQRGKECDCCKSAWCPHNKSTIEWQATRFSVREFETCLRYWCGILMATELSPSHANDELQLVA